MTIEPWDVAVLVVLVVSGATLLPILGVGIAWSLRGER